MNYDRGVGFIGGFVFGGLAAGAVALLFAPASGEETREQIRFESVAFKHRSQVFRDDKRRQAKKMIKQRRQDVLHAQARLSDVIDDRKDHLRRALDVGKQGAATRGDKIHIRPKDHKAVASVYGKENRTMTHPSAMDAGKGEIKYGFKEENARETHENAQAGAK